MRFLNGDGVFCLLLKYSPKGSHESMEIGDLKFKNLVILTGAGISAESGINTFRDSGGLWEQHRIEDVATPEAYLKDPQMVWRFYSMRRIQAAKARPNLAHEALVKFAKSLSPGQNMHLITQNVDCLHQRADSLHDLDPVCMHGSLHQSRCTTCDLIYYDDYAYFDEAGNYAPQETILCTPQQKSTQEYLHHYKLEYRNFLPLSPCCKSPMRPHIVWFGEIPLHMEKISHLLESCDLFMSVGTSGQVYPAAGFLRAAKLHGAKTICMNKESIPHAESIDHFIQGSAVDVVPKFFNLK
jgi:NAD-dependent deacetylase